MDENIPVQLKAIFHGHVVKSVNDKDVGWKNIKNGRLLAEMDGRFDLLITADRNIYTQQNLSGRRICILVLPANRRKDVLALGERIVGVVDGISVTEPEEDPALAPFLALLERDLAARPERLVALTPELAARITPRPRASRSIPTRRSRGRWNCNPAVLQPYGWRLFGHPLPLSQLDKLIAAAERTRLSDLAGWQGNANVKLLATLRDLMVDRVPREPVAAEFRQGNTLGPAHRHWFRAKFGGNRFRLFFRADSASRIVVYAWVNDRDTLRRAGARSDPHAMFARMLAHGNPPDDWPGLLAAAQEPTAVQRFAAVAPKP